MQGFVKCLYSNLYFSARRKESKNVSKESKSQECHAKKSRYFDQARVETIRHCNPAYTRLQHAAHKQSLARQVLVARSVLITAQLFDF
jgi:hypothetical protein